MSDQIDVDGLREGMMRFGEAITRDAREAMTAVGAALSGTKPPTPRHDYLSTACWHELNDGTPDLHGSCRATCKTCNASCSCPNHPETDSQPTPPSWVDQARNIALQAIRDAGDRLSPELAEQIRTDPRLFWARGEVQPPGQWQPDPQEDA